MEIAKGLKAIGSEDDDGQKSVNEGVVVIDFGSQYSHLIARRIRELKVYSMVAQSKSTWDSVKHLNPKGVILSGGPASVYEEGAPRIPDWVFEQHLPVLGICYGMQAMVHQLGGKVAPGAKQEFGYAILHQDSSDSGDMLFSELPPSFQVWMSHGDRVESLPPGFTGMAYTENSPLAAIGNGDKLFGIQFHPEVNLSLIHI